jgi:hypothetical protein
MLVGGWGFVARVTRALVEGWQQGSSGRWAHVSPADQDRLRAVAEECVDAVRAECGRELVWSLGSLSELDAACACLVSNGRLSDERLESWCKLTGAYTGEVLIRTYGGEWVGHERSSGAPAVAVHGITVFPFTTAQRILTGEPFKSFASVGRGVSAVIERREHPARS